MFERTEVWESSPEGIWVYVVFCDLRTGLFHVQQANAFQADDPSIASQHLARMNLAEVDLFLEQPPSQRSKGFLTVLEAVEHHKVEFAEMVSPSH